MDRHLVTQLSKLDAELTQQRRIRLSIRAVWIAGLVLCLGLIVRGWTSMSLSLPILIVLTILVLALGLVYAWLPTRGTQKLAQELDHAYGLNEQLGTAHEINYYEERGGFSDVLVDRARRRLAILSNDVISATVEPLRVEIQALSMIIVLFAGILLLGGMSRGLPNANVQPLPELAQRSASQPPNETSNEPDQPAPSGERPASNQQGGQPELNERDQQAADALAEALRDNAATRSAADALQQGDTQRAADELRELADQADQLSEQAQNDIADALDQAANDLQNQPELADRLRDQANRLRSDNPQAAQNALDDLAQTVEDLGNAEPSDSAANQNQQGAQGQKPSDQSSTGEQGQQENGSGGQGNNPASERRASPPADATGQGNLPLPDAPNPNDQTVPSQGNGNTTITLPGDGSSGGSGASGGSGGSVPADMSDPSLIPPELRDAIQNYFGR